MSSSDPKIIYLDNASTTFIDSRVREAMVSFLNEKAGNASSVHRLGVKAAVAVERARGVIAGAIKAAPTEIVFTSGGTESNNLALKGAARALREKGDHVVVSAIEHPSVLETARWLERNGFRVTYLPVDGEGLVDPGEVAKAVTDKTILVSVMHGNNELGTIQPIEEIGKICRSKGALFHTDACQSFTKEDIDVERQFLDLASLNAHKIHGPRGVGALYIRKGIELEPLFHGGGQEDGLRSGTYNTEGIAGFGKAVETAGGADIDNMRKLRDYFIEAVLGGIKTARLNGHRWKRLCNFVNFLFPGKDGKEIADALNARGIVVSPGSACHARQSTPSAVLLALGLSPEEARGGVRITLSKWTTRGEIDRTVEALAAVAAKGEGRG